jgi:hypothetical protein
MRQIPDCILGFVASSFFVATISDKNHRKVWNELEKRRNFAPEIKKQFINLEI